ncbi:transcriptional regulatory protein YciT [Yersinia frederiksenii]|uniref:DNA-binding transcriptional regulator YciT n=1 Tax=Yersinia alsatica TaxID=2890317 RepID=A0ABY5UKF7_9GAMM|nr:DNA-binding transcriptional regulator YciT [Yersinia alsatica]OWF70663.1 DeoR family transcriptional regulator [Yersinia frederiksenii]OWF76335.1 DeoR family transcriptional regulator [Yersinia frederiksenii]UWM43928.1 DNA-binding transcriptional regulator YciT [Yersinia alsatica]CFQ58196.1 transcriptional regulatory protein YciT [Yersinia frederiksenii]CNH88542.1 transcriptional regulatory protein YciT [Yersinia frederiksenii]
MNLRQQSIIQLVNDRQRISVSELAQANQVSEVTIRQDLNLLEKRGLLKRVHGSAVALQSDDVDVRMMSHFATKQKLANHAASLVNDGETIFIESGSSNALLAHKLAQRPGITLVTVSGYIARQLKDSACEVILLGGIYQKKSDSMVGPLTQLCLRHVHFSKAFIGIDGYQPNAGFTGRDMLRAEVINSVLAKGAENIILADASKFGQVHQNSLAPLSSISRVITDNRLPTVYQQQLIAQGIQVDILSE